MSPAAGRWTIEPGEPAYPAQLHELDEPALPVLHGAGNRSAVAGLDRDATVTIVGSRRPTPYGIRIAEALGHDLAVAGATVASGMASGIDAAAHRGALAGRGSTVAVLGGGPDVVYPASERRLYRGIVETGAAISEHPPGVAPTKWSFPARNRIMAALAGFVVIVEARLPSGSLITADVAQRLGRELGAVPGQVGVAVAEGTNGLIRDGAHLISCAQDVLDRLAGVGVASLRAPGPALDHELGRALDLVEAGVSTADALAVELGLEPQLAAIALARLELLGYVLASPAGAYVRSGLPRPRCEDRPH